MQNDLMTVDDLQKALINEIEDILKDVTTIREEVEDPENPTQYKNYHLKYGDGTRNKKGFTGYAQFLPKLENDDDDPDQFFPYFIVRIDRGKTEDDDSLWTVTVDILIGVHDADTRNDGHLSVMNAINRIVTRFAQEATLGYAGRKAFRCHSDMEWALQDEDTWPYFFGGVELKFDVPKPMRKEPNYGYW